MKSIYKLIFISLLLLSIFCTSQTPEIKVTLKAIPSTLPDTAQVFIAGNHEGLGNWDSDKISLYQQADGSWSRTFFFRKGTHLEYRITRGKWENQAIDSNGVEYPRFILDVVKDTVVTVNVANWLDYLDDQTILSANRLRNKGGNICLCDNWKYHPGDDLSWADPGFDDSSWETVLSYLSPKGMPSSAWNGVGWFRLHLTVDSSLWEKTLAFQMIQAGASEVYLNGQLLYRFGNVGKSGDDEIPYLDTNPRPIQFASQSNQVLAVRYSNFNAEVFHRFGEFAGYRCEIFHDLDERIDRMASIIKSNKSYQLIFSIIPVALAILHLLLFSFYPRTKENLYYAICMMGWAVVIFGNFQHYFTTSATQNIWIGRISTIAIFVGFVFGILTAYTTVYKKFPKHYIGFVGVGIILPVMGLIWEGKTFIHFLYAIFFGISALEIIRVFLIPGKQAEKGRWIVGFGFIALLLAIFYQVLIAFKAIQPIGDQSIVYIYGVLALAVSVSVNLSWKFAHINKDLASQLAQVKDLSERTIRQERRAKEEEIQRRLLEADNERKTKELKEARQLQLSMLPSRIPVIPHLNIAAHMETASEVGGDYYDFHLEDDGTLTIVLGDATGHGIKAGTMVAAIKSLFGAFGGNPDIPEFFNRCSEIIKGMNLGNLYMAMQIVKIKDHQMVTSAAGMPPILIFRSKTGKLEEIELKGLPIGGQVDYVYDERMIELQEGDILLMMSDGYPELFNDEKEMLDYERVKKNFWEVVQSSPQQIIRHLMQKGKEWSNGKPQNDDITFVVIKVY